MRIAKGEFTRKPPAQFGERVELPLGWCVIRHGHLDDQDKRREVTYRWAVILCGKQKIFRVIRFGASLASNEIVLDWPGWIDLQGRRAKILDSVQLEIRTPHLLEYLCIPFAHVDPGYRLSAWLGAISIGLGALSVVLAFLV
jgi:hypothetical protein